MKRFGVADMPSYIGTGCQTCDGLGYKGRTGIFELLVLTDQLRTLIVKEPSAEKIHTQAAADGMSSLLQDGLEKVAEGIVSIDELARVVM